MQCAECWMLVYTDHPPIAVESAGRSRKEELLQSHLLVQKVHRTTMIPTQCKNG